MRHGPFAGIIPGLFLAPVLLFFLAAGVAPAASTGAGSQAKTKIFLQEDFSSLGGWMPFCFFKKKKPTLYLPDVKDGMHCVKAQSDRSSSALVYKKEFDVYKYPVVKWEWMVGNIYPRGDLEKKSANDSPARLYILFKYDPEKAGFFTRLKYTMAKMIYGMYPPGSSLCYLWASHPHERRILASPAWKYCKDIVLEGGPEYLNQWREEKINILEDYRAVFGKDPPRMAAIAIVNNSDNLGGKSTSWFGDIEITAPEDSGGDHPEQAGGAGGPEQAGLKNTPLPGVANSPGAAGGPGTRVN